MEGGGSAEASASAPTSNGTVAPATNGPVPSASPTAQSSAAQQQQQSSSPQPQAESSSKAGGKLPLEEILYETTEEAKAHNRRHFGLLGILNVIRTSDPLSDVLALGMDLTTLGLDLNAPESLYLTFASPFSDHPCKKEPERFLPHCYYANPPQLKVSHFGKFQVETLFYIFYNMPRDTLQAYAAFELYARKWLYHQERELWFIEQQETANGAAPTSRWQFFDTEAGEWQVKFFNGDPPDKSKFLPEKDVRDHLARILPGQANFGQAQGGGQSASGGGSSQSGGSGQAQSQSQAQTNAGPVSHGSAGQPGPQAALHSSQQPTVSGSGGGGQDGDAAADLSR
mmetsp:Transcript_4167/g.8464  ORF Transcript_4167/g.8464 Transcript_4167/m.8464 type:complete len:341 (+) Transcript_4167:227-1249(+)